MTLETEGLQLPYEYVLMDASEDSNSPKKMNGDTEKDNLSNKFGKRELKIIVPGLKAT